MMRIEQAIARAKEQGKKVLKKDIAAKLWPDSTPSAQQVNMTALCNGATARISPEWVAIICEMTGCSADFLLGLPEKTVNNWHTIIETPEPGFAVIIIVYSGCAFIINSCELGNYHDSFGVTKWAYIKDLV